MSDIFFGAENELKVSPSKGNIAKKSKTLSITQSLNLGNISKELTLNTGEEGLCKIRPKSLRPSAHNPRPDWYIDDLWLKQHALVDFDDVFENELESSCLVKITEVEENGDITEKVVFPDFNALQGNPEFKTKKQYEFLVELARSIRDIGQVQPIEVETNHESNCFVVLEGHLRRLACILGRVPFIKAVRNEGLQEVNRDIKVERQITENSLRKSLSPYGVYKLVAEFLEASPGLTTREISNKVKISQTYASLYKKLVVSQKKISPLIYICLEKDLLSSRSLKSILAAKSLKSQENLLKKFLGKEYESLTEYKNSKPKEIVKEGRKRSVSMFKISTESDCIRAGNKLLSLLPSLKANSELKEVSSIEDMDKVLNALVNILLEK